MNRFSAFLVSFRSRLTRAFKRIGRAWSDWRNPPYRTEVAIGQLPSRLSDRVLYVVEEDGYEEQAAMRCPCGCGRTLQMNLLPDERPCWRLTRHENGTSTLHPSVWRQKDCRSHFWFRRGRVIWVDERR